MLKDKQWITKTSIDKRNRITLPPAFTMCSGIKVGDALDVICGANFSCVVIVPTGLKIQSRNMERIKILVEEGLE